MPAELDGETSIKSKMKKLTISAALILTVGAFESNAASTASQSLSFSISQYTDLTLNDSAVVFSIGSIPLGGLGQDTKSSSYNLVSNNHANQKITAALDQAMPSGTTLKINAHAPTTAASAGVTTLSDSAQDLVTGLVANNLQNQSLDYTFNASELASPGSFSRTITLTIAAQ